MRPSRWLRLAAVLLPLYFALLAFRPALASAGDRVRGSLGVGAGMRGFGSPNADLRQYRLVLSPTLVLGGIGEAGVFVTMTRSNALLQPTSGLPLRMELSVPWQPTVGARFGVNVAERQWFRLSLSAEFECVLDAERSRIDAVSPSGDLASAMHAVDRILALVGRSSAGIVGAGIRGATSLSHVWTVTQAELTLAARFGMFEPSLGLGVLRLQQSTKIDILPELRELLDELDVSLRTRFATDTTVPLIAPGVRMDLGADVELRLRGVWLSSREFSFTAFDGAIYLPLNF